jgi:diguanylate cyclase (GGDEF)-like protein
VSLDFSRTGWARVFLGTIAGTLFCVAIAVYVDSFNFVNLSPKALYRALMVDILLPTFLAGPLLFLLLGKIRQLAVAHRELAIVASTDSLTTVLNRGAFTLLVDAYLKQAGRQAALRRGSLLVIDADHFKSINDRFGHQVGDLALKTIAKIIKGELRHADLVGRIGGEEFGVFLPGADRAQAAQVAERIRTSVSHVSFPPTASRSELSVSVGGVSFDREVPFDDLFKAADDRLYAAKSNGRNRIDVEEFAGPFQRVTPALIH